MRIVCWQTILMKYQTLVFRKFGKMSQNLSSAAVVIGALRVNIFSFQGSWDKEGGVFWSKAGQSSKRSD